MLVSIGGLKVKSVFHAPYFFLLAAPSLRQAQEADGNLFSQVKGAQGRQFSLTAWESPAAMKVYAKSGAHARAMAAAARVASDGYFHFYHSDALPDWGDALARWYANEPEGGSPPFA